MMAAPVSSQLLSIPRIKFLVNFDLRIINCLHKIVIIIFWGTKAFVQSLFTKIVVFVFCFDVHRRLVFKANLIDKINVLTQTYLKISELQW